ncbi:MAG: class beta-lactamase-related serine hydrolase [Nevskia sp.]|nr:class beta-lactamase-related serine hydrolase [Nevskia sp.]
MTEAQTAGDSGKSIAAKLQALFQPWNRSDAPGLVIGVALGGVPVFRRGFGLASVEHGTANTPATRMRIASTSKHFAALAALLLVEEGKLDIDMPVRRYLPELAGPSGEPSLRQMMQHSSGIRDPLDLPGFMLFGSWSMALCAGAGLELGKRVGDANFAPGERMVYNNQGYHLLSLAIERVSGMPFAAFLKQRVLAPLDMADTELQLSDMQMVPGIASFHLAQPDGSYRRGIYPSEELTGFGGLVSTVDDMLKWLLHLRSEKKSVGTPKSWETMLQRPRYSSGATGDYCLGLVRETYRGVEIIHHAGAVIGCQSQMLTVPAHQLDISVMFNRMEISAPAIALKVVDCVLNGKLAPAVPPLNAEGRESVIGRWYSTASHRMFGVVACPVPHQSPVLALSIQDQLGGLLRETDGGLIMSCSAHGAVELRLPTGVLGRPETLEFLDSGHRELFARLPDSGPSVAALAPELVGRYRYADLDLELRVILEQDVLYLDLQPRCGTTRFLLTPYSLDVCGCTLQSTWPVPLPVDNFATTVAVERSGGKVSGLWLNSWRTRNLWLERCA